MSDSESCRRTCDSVSLFIIKGKGLTVGNYSGSHIWLWHSVILRVKVKNLNRAFWIGGRIPPTQYWKLIENKDFVCLHLAGIVLHFKNKEVERNTGKLHSYDTMLENLNSPNVKKFTHSSSLKPWLRCSARPACGRPLRGRAWAALWLWVMAAWESTPWASWPFGVQLLQVNVCSLALHYLVER